VRRIVLPGVLALAICGVLTSSSLAKPSDTGVDLPALVAAAAPVAQQPEMALAAPPLAEPTTPASSAPAKPPVQQTQPPAKTKATVAAKPQAADAPGTPVRNPGVFLPYNGDSNQMITVVAASSTATTATLTAWAREGTTWRAVFGPMTANVGSQGVGQASESTSKTPAGVFGLTESFGIQANNGTRLPFFQVDDSDWWVSDSASPEYNKHYRCAVGTCPFNEAAGERLKAAGAVYNHAVVIDYNRDPAVPGAGSAFFLHVSNGRPTAGCVSIPADQLDNIMQWLNPAQHPLINIG
jgi:L,D-peptidoglycan transpeptidase YkuD (ErfK/YbiS/YcfS/YnhG family)